MKITYNRLSLFEREEISKVAPAKGERIQVWTMIKMMLENLLTSPVKAEEFMVRI